MTGTIEQNRDHGGMAVERGRDGDRHAGQLGFDGGDHGGEVALEVDAECQEVRQHVNIADAARGEQAHGASEVGDAFFEEGGLDVFESALMGEVGSNAAHRFIGGFDARSVRKNDDARLVVRTQQVL